MREGISDSGPEAPVDVKTYRDFSDDFVESRHQDAALPDGFTWVHHNIFYRAAAAFLYVIAIIITFFYTRLSLHITVVNRKVIKESGGSGFFLYGNHTQPEGDAFAPVRYAFPSRIYCVISAANLGIPILGRFLPLIGGIPVPESESEMKGFLRALQDHIKRRHCVVIYPEAHVWPWCTFIRPFQPGSFRFPVMFGVPAFCVTTTYQKRRRGKKPKITAYVDGPFYPDPELGRKEAQKKLCDEIHDRMCSRCENSTYEYVKYVRENEA